MARVGTEGGEERVWCYGGEGSDEEWMMGESDGGGVGRRDLGRVVRSGMVRRCEVRVRIRMRKMVMGWDGDEERNNGHLAN